MDSPLNLSRPLKLIALTGPAGVGKTTIAAALERRGFVRYPFAGFLKAMLRAFYEAAGVEEAAIEARLSGPLKEEDDPLLRGASPRFAMQTLGTEWGRDMVDPDLWAEAWRAGTGALFAGGAVGVVADDLRYENEAAVVHALGGCVVRLRDGRRANLSPLAAAHRSEVGVSGDLEVENDRDPEAVADRMLREIALRFGVTW